MKQLKITLRRSPIGSTPKQRGALKALGLRKRGRSVLKPDRAEIRGMVARVSHLVDVEQASAQRRPRSARA